MSHQYISLSEAARQSPGRPHVASVWRWCRRGVKSRSGVRVRLGYVRAGGKLFTTEAALSEFFESVAKADAEHFDRPVPSPEATRAERHRERAIKSAETVLGAGGIL